MFIMSSFYTQSELQYKQRRAVFLFYYHKKKKISQFQYGILISFIQL